MRCTALTAVDEFAGQATRCEVMSLNTGWWMVDTWWM